MLHRIFVIVAVLATLSPAVFAQDKASSDTLVSSLTPAYLTDIDQPTDIHGYMETQVKTEHITPRGLVVADHGVEVQPAGAFTFNLYDGPSIVDKVSATVGIWNSLNSSLHIANAGPWFEVDYFARLNFQIANRVNLTCQYIAFDSPGGAFSTDNNLELTLAYDDTGYLAHNFGIHPYTRAFYNLSGSSTTVLGQNGNTYDVELGVVPTYVWKSIPRLPITFSLPTYVTVGPSNFWGGTENVGVFTTSLAANIPITCIPSRLGRWHLDTSVSYFNLLNGKLVDAANQLGNGRDRTRVVAEIGIVFDF